MYDAKVKLGYTNNEDLLSFQWLYSMQESTTASLIFDMPAPNSLGSDFVDLAPIAAPSTVPATGDIDLKVKFATTYDKLKEMSEATDGNSTAASRVLRKMQAEMQSDADVGKLAKNIEEVVERDIKDKIHIPANPIHSYLKRS